MKKITLLFISLFLLNTFGVAQLENIETTYQKTIIAGKIKKHQPDGNRQQIKLYLYRPEEKKVEAHRVDVASDGTFSISIQLAFSQEMILAYNRELDILVNPGDSLHLHFNGTIGNKKKLLKEVKFSGDNSEINKQWTDFRRNYRTVVTNTIFEAQKKLNYENFAKFRLNYKKELDNNIASFAKEGKPSKELIRWLKNKSRLDYLGDIARYPMAHAYYNKIEQATVNLPATYDEFLNNLPEIEKKDLSHASSIKLLVSTFNSNISVAVRNDKSNTKKDWHDAFSKGLENATLFKTGLFFQLMLSQRALTLIKIGEIEVYQKYYEPLINKYVKEEFLSTKISARLEEKLNSINNPLAASKAVLKNLNEINIANPFNTILEEHQGKVIYLDFWGTWCGPCIGEFPNSKKLHQDFKDKEIVFGYACIDSKEKVWKADLTKYQLKGSHYFFNKKQSDEIRKALEINGVPFYLIIDKNGTIIDKGSHLRPSYKKTQDKLASLLK